MDAGKGTKKNMDIFGNALNWVIDVIWLVPQNKHAKAWQWRRDMNFLMVFLEQTRRFLASRPSRSFRSSLADHPSTTGENVSLGVLQQTAEFKKKESISPESDGQL